MKGSRRFFMLACQRGRAGSGPARNVGDLESGLALQAPKVVRDVYRGLYTGTQALLTMHTHFAPLLLHALSTDSGMSMALALQV